MAELERNSGTRRGVTARFGAEAGPLRGSHAIRVRSDGTPSRLGRATAASSATAGNARPDDVSDPATTGRILTAAARPELAASCPAVAAVFARQAGG
jgi:hypothetical protein